MPEFTSPFSGLNLDRKMSREELIRAVRFSISAEYEAIQFYMQIADAADDPLTVAVMKDVADEERVHAGEFLRLLKTLAPEEERFYSEGSEEVEELMAEGGTEHLVKT